MMHLNFFVVGFDHVPENMAPVVVLTLSVTEPFIAVLAPALNHAPSIVDTAVNTRK